MYKLFLFYLFFINSAFAINDRYITIDNTKLHYYKLGHGSPIVMLTGYGVTSNFWSKPLVNCLKSSHTVYLFDYPGINSNSNIKDFSIQTLAKSVHNFILKLNIKQPIIVSWSMGSAVMLELNNSYPNKFKKLVFIAPLLPNKNIINHLKNNINANDVLNLVFTNNIYNYQTTDLAKYKKLILEPNKSLFTSNNINQLEQKAINEWLQADNLAKLNVRGKFLLAEHDLILNRELQANMLYNYTKGITILIKNSGHAIFYQYPNNVCHAILR